ncbi:PepSY domain-containing protein [Halalkalibacillus halophilus]|uniref:PepSY domain-containing protein n=1 Tax=Halalkalibacillus halophilus TaxID=392827 RepID=UPI00042165E6|nr:PepSY domain-containing protein [Halalkalibacillus halophilus]
MKKERLIWMLGGALLSVVAFFIIQQFVFGNSSAEPLTEQEAEEFVLSQYEGDVLEMNEEDRMYFVELQTSSGLYLVEVDKMNRKVRSIHQVEQNETEEEEVESDEVTEEQIDEAEDTDSNQDEQEQESNDSSSESNEMEDENEEVEVLTEEEVRELIVDRYDGDITSIEFTEGDNPIYEVEIEKEAENVFLVLHAETGDVISENRQEVLTDTMITREYAIELALEEFYGEVEDVELEEINGTLFYIIEIDNDEQDLEADIQINAYTGEVESILWDD